MTVRHLNQGELARRWSLSSRTLERWRWQRKGPPFLKVGGRVVYRLEDIEGYEAAQLRQRDDAEPAQVLTSTSQLAPVPIGSQVFARTRGR